MWSASALRFVLPSALLFVAAVLTLLNGQQASAQVGAKPKTPSPTPPAAADARNQDRTAIRAALESLAKAFSSRDPKALAASWSTEGEYRRDDGVTVKGRESLEKAFEAFFAKTPEVKAEIKSESLRFLSADTAVDEGSVTVQRGPAEQATNAHYHAILVREEGRWKVAQLNESSDDKVSIADLGWLIGEWKSTTGEGAEIRTTYAWTPNKKFIRVEFTIKEKNLALSGNQVIGVDPATGTIRSWTFEADGGVGETDWTRDGDHWVLELDGTLADGRTLTETNILRRVSSDTLTWQSINRLLDDVAIPDLAPVKITRVTPQK